MAKTLKLLRLLLSVCPSRGVSTKLWALTSVALLFSLSGSVVAAPLEMPGLMRRELSFYRVADREVLHGPYRESMGEKLLVDGNYRDGLKDGQWEEWHENGIPKSSQLWEKGSPQGWLRTYHPSGNLKLKVEFENGKKKGFEESWYDNGDRKSYTSWLDGIKHGPHQQWFENGQEALRCMYERGDLNGPYKKWNEAGELILEEIYQLGVQRKILLASEKYNNGNMKVAFSYYLDDQRQEVKHGKFNKWFPNGEIWIQCTYVHGTLDGLWQYGKLDGLHCRQEQYVRGVKHGDFKFFHQGQLIKEERWREGEKIEVKEY